MTTTSQKSTEIVRVLAMLADAGHEIVECDFRTGCVTFRVSAAQVDVRLSTVLQCLRGGSKIEAIKEYRGEFGVSLAEAKTVVEDLMVKTGIGTRDPHSGIVSFVEKISAGPGPTG